MTITASTTSIDNLDLCTIDAASNRFGTLDTEGTNEKATCFYDKAAFIGEGFDRAAASIDHWVGVQTKKVLSDDGEFAEAESASPKMTLLTDLHMYLPSFYADFTENMTAHIALMEMLEDTISEVRDLPEAEHGHYLAQLATRWFSDGTIGWMRFRLANLLATYYQMMPLDADYLGIYECDIDDFKMFGWSTDHGVYLDVVHVFAQTDCSLDSDITVATEFGRRCFRDDFAGVRYLPLEDLRRARLYESDGTWQPVVERDLLDSVHLL